MSAKYQQHQTIRPTSGGKPRHGAFASGEVNR
jgi:hypothetical protein